MLPSVRRRTVVAGVRFCDSCAELTTAQQRARRHDARVRAQVQAFVFAALRAPYQADRTQKERDERDPDRGGSPPRAALNFHR
jgi:hypothetical protein